MIVSNQLTRSLCLGLYIKSPASSFSLSLLGVEMGRFCSDTIRSYG